MMNQLAQTALVKVPRPVLGAGAAAWQIAVNYSDVQAAKRTAKTKLGDEYTPETAKTYIQNKVGTLLQRWIKVLRNFVIGYTLGGKS